MALSKKLARIVKQINDGFAEVTSHLTALNCSAQRMIAITQVLKEKELISESEILEAEVKIRKAVKDSHRKDSAISEVRSPEAGADEGGG